MPPVSSRAVSPAPSMSNGSRGRAARRRRQTAAPRERGGATSTITASGSSHSTTPSASASFVARRTSNPSSTSAPRNASPLSVSSLTTSTRLAIDPFTTSRLHLGSGGRPHRDEPFPREEKRPSSTTAGDANTRVGGVNPPSAKHPLRGRGSLRIARSSSPPLRVIYIYTTL